jgi:linoleoyl-CoA desaturase
MAIGEAGIGMAVMHDAAHGSFSDKRWVNQLFSSSMYLLGNNTFNWKVQHNVLYHTYTNINGYDQDIGTKAVIRLCDHAPLRKVHRFQLIYAFLLYGLMTLSKLVTDFNPLIEFNQWGMASRQQSSPRKEMVMLIVSKVAYVSIVIGLPLWLTNFSWWQVLIGFAVIHLTAGMIMSTIFQMAHVVEGAKQPLPDSEGVLHEEWVVHQLHSTSGFARHNFLLNWYVGASTFRLSTICSQIFPIFIILALHQSWRKQHKRLGLYIT